MKDFFLYLLFFFNFFFLLYLYFKFKEVFGERIDLPLKVLSEKLEERLQDLQEIRRDLIRLYTSEDLIRIISEEVHKISSILLGRKSGQAGERTVEEMLAHFPLGMIVRDLRLSTGVVEFALRLKGGKFLPIDSKLFASEVLAKGEINPQEEKELLRKTRERAKEITNYLRDERSSGFAIMAIPDGLYSFLSLRLHADLEKEGIILVPYQLLPQILILISLLWERFFFQFSQDNLLESLPIFEQTLAELLRDVDQAQRELKSVLNLFAKVQTSTIKLQTTLSKLKELR